MTGQAEALLVARVADNRAVGDTLKAIADALR